MPDPKYSDDLQTVALPATEVFSTGTWNGDVYTTKDLDQMVEAFHALKSSWEPVAKAGHEDGQEKPGETRRIFGAPALGYIDNLFRTGERLMATFKSVPKRFASLIRAGSYRKISSEVYWNYKNPATGTIYPRVLKAVAFLGAEIPAVTNLQEIEALFSVKENGLLVAFDEQENEFRAYHNSYCSDDCPHCKDDKGEQMAEEQDTAEYEDETTGQVVQAKDHFVRKRDGKWCVISHEGKTLGCHPSRGAAVNQLRAVEANKKHSHKSTEVDMPGMTEDEINALMKKREEELKGVMFKEFEDRIHKAREEGKEEASKEAEALREDIRKLQLEKRSERIETWLKQMKEQGKLLPAEESKVRSLRCWIPDEGPELKYFAVKEGKTQEFQAGPAEIFESLFGSRKSIYQTLSTHDEASEDAGQELPDAGAEVDRRAKRYMETKAKENAAVPYGQAVRYVLSSNPNLAERYRRQTN